MESKELEIPRVGEIRVLRGGKYVMRIVAVKRIGPTRSKDISLVVHYRYYSMFSDFVSEWFSRTLHTYEHLKRFDGEYEKSPEVEKEFMFHAKLHGWDLSLKSDEE